MQKVVIAIVLCLHMCLSAVFGQQKVLQAEHVTYTDLVKMGYGLDQDLVNGLQYYNRYIRCKGDPYFQSNHFRKGSITGAATGLLPYSIGWMHFSVENISFRN